MGRRSASRKFSFTLVSLTGETAQRPEGVVGADAVEKLSVIKDIFTTVANY